jgi:hypothetical protein
MDVVQSFEEIQGGTMTYETPEILDLGPVEKLTYGGEIVPVWYDFFTGYTGHILQPPRD